ncbi:uncharacterized protein TNCT_566461 [Trichonephila clavata]|uniref:Uncharacterized protein n=1 Tax=Trichonephila clavata TaxID=2740835 RepID=A0A8X6IMK5_TRICU|nr:uncharacterized protein TNCT_566461 [Trichonephila clavata]
MKQEGEIDFSTTSRREYVEKTAEKVSPVKPVSSTKITGKFDGTTTNQAMFQDSPREKVKAFKPQDNLKLEGGNFADGSTTKTEFQNWEYVKPSAIKHESTMRQEGDIDFSTTMSREYVGKTAEEIALLKSRAYKPQDNLKVESGDFANESVTRTEYQNWEYVKPSAIKHESTMRQEGDIDFSTTMSREYVGKTAEEIALLKSRAYKPQDNLKLEGGDFTSESTTRKEFQNWEYVKQTPVKHDSSMRQEGDIDFSTTSRREYVEKTAEKVSPVKPVSSTKITGKFDGTTTNQVMFQDSPREKVKSFKPQDNLKLEGGNFANESTTKMEYQNWEYVKPSPIKHDSTMRQEGDIDFSTTMSREYVGKTAEEIALLKSRAYKPQDNLKLEGGDFTSESTTRKEFQNWEYVKQTPVKHDSSMRQEGDIDFSTTSRREYVEKTAEKVSPVKPASSTKITGKFDGTTTNQVMFQDSPREKVKAFKPQDNLKLEGGNFANESITKKEYQNWEYVKPSPIKHDSSMRQEGDIDFSTTNRREYVGKTAEEMALLKSQAYRPHDNLKLESGDFANESITKTEYQNWEYVKPSAIKHESTMRQEGDIDFSTTNRREYVGKTAEEMALLKSQSFKPQDNLKLEGGDFTSESITKKEFQNWEYVKPSPIKHESTMRQEGDIDFSTTSRREYVEKTAEKVSPVKPVSSTKITGKFEGTTTNQAMFQDSPREKVKAFKPQDNLKLEGGDFADGSTTKAEFQNWEYVKALPIKHDSTMRQEGEIDFSTTSRREYVGKTAEEIALLKSRAYKPQDNLKLEGGDFSNESITKTEYQNWEYVKPTPIKHDSTMKQEGDIDFSTTSRREYIGKTAEKVSPIKPVSSTKITGKFEGTTTNQAMFQDSPREKAKAFKPQDNLKLEGGDFTSESTTKKEFQNWEYVKPSPIKHDSTMRQEGDIDFSTTTRREYIGKTAEEIALLKSRAYKPQDNLKLESGDFANQSTTKTEFQNWEYVKQTPVKHDSTMKQEGDMDFSTTTRREYVGKTAEKVSPVKPVSSTKVTGKFEGTTTNQAMFQDSPREKVKAFKPKDNLKLEGGDFANESTTKKEYQNWEYVKPSPIKHESTMKQEGDIDFSTTNKREFVGKTAEKVSPVKPVSSTKISGEFDGTTTNQAMFQAKKSVEKVKGKRPQTNIQLEKGKFEDQTTARREFQQWEINKPKPIKPTGNLAQDGDMDFTTSNKTDFQPKSVPAVQPIRPKPSSPVSGEFDGTTTNKVMFQAQTAERVHDIRPKDNLRVDSGQFIGETTNSKEFNFKAGAKPEPIKPKSNLTQEGEFDFKTSNQTEFEKKQISKVSQIRPKTQTKTSDGKFYSTTTNQAMFQTPQMQNVHGIKPSDNLHVEKGKFQSNTTSTDEYQQWKIQKQKANQLASSLKQEGNMQFETTNKTEFKERSFDRVQQIRPKTTNKLIEGDFDSTTTNQVMFQEHGSVQRAKPIRHESNLRLEGGKFANETTNTREFRQWVKMENKDSQNKKKIEAAGVRSQKEKSETKKDSGAQNIKVTGDKDQHEPWKLNKETGETIVKETKTVSGQSEIRLADDKTKTQSETQQLKRSEETTQVVKSKIEVSKSDISMQKQEIETRSSQTTQRTNGERQHRVREITSVTTDSGGKPSPKVKSIVPAGNLSSEGDMTFATTSQTDFSHQTATMSKSESKQMSSSVKEVSEMRSQKSVGNVKTRTSTGGNLFGEGDMSFATTSKSDFSPQKISGDSKQMSSTPKGTVSRQSKVAVENEIALNATLSRRSVSKESLSKGMSSRDNSMSPQKTPTKTKRFRPEDNLKIESVPFDATSTTRTEFQKWETRRSSSKKRNESLKQEGSMEFNVTSNDYSQMAYQANRDQIKAKSKADQRGSLGQSGAMEFHTTSNSSYTVHAGSYGTKSKTVRPRTSLKLGSEEATSKQDAMSSSRSNPEVSSSELVSTSRAAYVSHTPSRRSVANRPPTNQKIGEGSFESQTTTRSSFAVHQGQVEKPRIVKHESHNILNTENGFTGKSTYRNSFETVRTHHCPVLDLEAGRSALSFNEEKNGHLFYAPNVEMNVA